MKENTTTKLPIEEAIDAWEKDATRNPDGNKIVRGKDGKPVEIFTVSGGECPTWAFVVNGQQMEQFQIGGNLQSIEKAMGNLIFEQFLHMDLFDKWYDLKGVQRLNASVQVGHQGFVSGKPGTAPDTIHVNFRGN